MDSTQWIAFNRYPYWISSFLTSILVIAFGGKVLWWNFYLTIFISSFSRCEFSLLHKQVRREAESGGLGAEHAPVNGDRHRAGQSERSGRSVLLAREWWQSSLQHRETWAQELQADREAGVSQISSEHILCRCSTFERTWICVIQGDRKRTARVGQIEIRIFAERTEVVITVHWYPDRLKWTAHPASRCCEC